MILPPPRCFHWLEGILRKMVIYKSPHTDDHRQNLWEGNFTKSPVVSFVSRISSRSDLLIL